VLTNMHIDLDYDTLAAELPPHVTPAYDGMVLDVAAADGREAGVLVRNARHTALNDRPFGRICIFHNTSYANYGWHEPAPPARHCRA
jgi:hypothetical protein